MLNEPSLIAALEGALRSAAPEKRSAALDHVVELFVAGADRYSDAQIALFDEVFVKLATDIETKARRKLACRLAPLPRAPKGAIRRLAGDPSAAVAAPVLSQSLQLDDYDLVMVATTGSQDHLHALCRRPALNEAVTDVLIERGDRSVALSLATNVGARISEATFELLVRRSAGDDVLTQAVGTRPDLPRHHFVELLAGASASVRVKLISASPSAARDIEAAIADAVVGIGRDAGLVDADPDLAKAEMQRLLRGGRRGDVDTQAAARARKFDQTAAALSLVCRVPMAVAERALVEDTPDMLLILAKAAGCSWKTTKTLLQIRIGESTPPAEQVARARADFERLQVATAIRVLARYRATLRPPPPADLRDNVA